ncbi:hypothetical protein ZWY2020_022315 [Hordeum vulgare]|nr:hypothetical protein ZWY2020_022315 [Hordeum vulgare]
MSFVSNGSSHRAALEGSNRDSRSGWRMPLPISIAVGGGRLCLLLCVVPDGCHCRWQPPNILHPGVCKTLACRRGVNWAAQIEVTRLILEMDIICVAATLVSAERYRFLYGPLVEEFKYFLHDFQEIICQIG